MTVARFLNWIQYSSTCPHGVSLQRFHAMFLWFRARILEGESLESLLKKEE